jgi:hypothetical protein
MPDDQVKGPPAAPDSAGQDVAAASGPDAGVSAGPAPTGFWRHAGELIRRIRSGDDAMVEAIVVQLSRRRRILAPLALAVGAVAMLFDGLRLLLFNWRLTLVQVLPAMWTWATMLDLKVHVLHGASFREWRGPVLILVMAGVVAITMASFFLNAVFAFAIARPGPPKIRPAFITARSHAGVLDSGGPHGCGKAARRSIARWRALAAAGPGSARGPLHRDITLSGGRQRPGLSTRWTAGTCTFGARTYCSARLCAWPTQERTGM